MKKFWFMLTALVATCFLVACRGSQGVSTKTIKENKKIVVATESEFAPFEFKSLEQTSSWLKLSEKNLV